MMMDGLSYATCTLLALHTRDQKRARIPNINQKLIKNRAQITHAQNLSDN
jgi:hypothetical protein